MGKYDSSLTRVAPVFDELMRCDGSGQTWIHRLLALPRHGAKKPPDVARFCLRKGPVGTTHGWGEREVPLYPPLSLLTWLVRNLAAMDRGSILGSGKTLEKRQALVRQDPSVVSEALELLGQQPRGRGWHILEGPSYPDVFLDTHEAIIVVEGKRTEPGPTTRTTFMPRRHQMLRHMDCAWEIREQRPIYGFFIVEGPEISSAWEGHAAETVSESVLESSLPHRTPEERAFIKQGFLGVTTWQAVCDAMEIDSRSLPEEVAAN